LGEKPFFRVLSSCYLTHNPLNFFLILIVKQLYFFVKFNWYLRLVSFFIYAHKMATFKKVLPPRWKWKDLSSFAAGGTGGTVGRQGRNESELMAVQVLGSDDVSACTVASSSVNVTASIEAQEISTALT
jgi:hypothetical protein